MSSVHESTAWDAAAQSHGFLHALLLFCKPCLPPARTPLGCVCCTSCDV